MKAKTAIKLNQMAITRGDLQEMIKSTINQALRDQKATFTVRQCARYSGIGEDKLRELIAKENTDFPFFKVGVKAIIPKEPLDRWLEMIAKENRQL